MEPTTIEGVCHDLVFDGPMPAKAVATAIHKDYRRMQAELAGTPGYKLGAATLLRIVQATGDLAPLAWLANQVGAAVVDLRPAVAVAREQAAVGLVELSLSSMREFGESAEALRKALADGKIDRRELVSIETEAWEAVTAILAVVEAARRAAEGR